MSTGTTDFISHVSHGLLLDDLVAPVLQVIKNNVWLIVAFTVPFLALQYALAVPADLAHLPRVSPYRMIWSYIIKESVDKRTRKLILPFAERGEGVVLVFMLGKWGVHVLDPDLIKTVCHDMNKFPKKNYQEHLHFSLLSGPNVVFSNGEMWKRHSACVRAAFDREMPVHRFVALAHEVFDHIGTGGTHSWSDLVQKYTVDVVGSTLLGHNFEALKTNGDSIVEHFNRVMKRISTPIRFILPFLDNWLPRHEVIADINALNKRFDDVLEMKKQEFGHDLLSYLLEDSTLTSEELRSNVIILFSAGHDTTSGAICSAAYYLAKHPEYQAKARQEVLEVLGDRDEPTYEDHPKFTFLYACMQEATRINQPISLLPARWTEEAVVLGKYAIPANVSIVPNVCAAHHTSRVHPDPYVFDPYRFLDKRVRPYTHVPFGTGPRQCLARQFSLYEQRTLLCMLLKNYEWHLPEGSIHAHSPVNEFGAFGLSIPHELDIVFVKRK